jgi:photosystem II stability/assembly factor-like uncharacterized protein
MSKKIAIAASVATAFAVVLVLILVAPRFQRSLGPDGGKVTLADIKQSVARDKAERKARLKAEGKLYEPGMFPSDWGFAQRAYPYGTINLAQVKQAVTDAQALRISAARSPAGLGTGWVEEGPTNIGARVTDIVISPSDPNTIYAAHASSGVFKSTDGGGTWFPISDDLPVLTIGAIALDPNDPSTVYVGTGEANANSYSFFGLGLFKSTDGGSTWDYMGLEETRYIARIVVDPNDGDRLWVAATGALFGTNPERGIYRSMDGGETWDLVLSVSDSTAATDVAIDPTRPDTVYAAMWERVRGLTYRKSGGATSAIYRSYDGGDTWTKLTNGLPSGSTVGRIGLSVCEAAPNTIYASYADHPGYFAGVYKSTDCGDTWTRTNDSALADIYSNFGWYFGQVRVDPANANRVFVQGVELYRTQDGGATWAEVGSQMHVDHHAMAFDPTDPARIIDGNDGGIYRSTNNGTNWQQIKFQPTNQFYAIEIDFQHPERLYGGTQDNGTLRTTTGATNDWEEIFGGDGFYCIVDPTNSNVVYCEYQYGMLYKSTNFCSSWVSARSGIPGGDRRDWMTPVVMDPSDNLTLYYGTYRVFKTTNGAGLWAAVSGDLTNGDQGANFGTITTLAVAATDADVIYVGTDDANLWVTQNGGGSWADISTGLPNRWVTRVAVDPTDAAIAYVTFSGLRWNEQIGHVYRTADYGASWQDVSTNLPDAPANVIVLDPDHPSRLFVGTDVGCFYTDAPGEDWQVLGPGLPPVPVLDLKIHSPTRTLVAGTHGRSMYSFDLTQLPDVSGIGVAAPPVVSSLSNKPNPFASTTDISFVLAGPGRISLDIYDLAGRRVRSLGAMDLGAGRHQVRWDGRNQAGRPVASGVYFARLEMDGRAVARAINLVR